MNFLALDLEETADSGEILLAGSWRGVGFNVLSKYGATVSKPMKDHALKFFGSQLQLASVLISNGPLDVSQLRR